MCMGCQIEGLGLIELGQTQTMFKALFYMFVGDLGELLSSGMLLGLLVMSCSQSVIRDSTIPCMTQRILGILMLNMATDTSTMWLRLGTEPSLSQLPQRMQGVYVGVRNSQCELYLVKSHTRVATIYQFIDTNQFIVGTIRNQFEFERIDLSMYQYIDTYACVFKLLSCKNGIEK